MLRRIVIWTRLIITGLCGLAGLGIGLPLFGEYRSNQQSIAELEALVESYQSLKLQEASILKTGEELKNSIADFQKRATTGKNVTEVRDAILGLIRDHGCKVRQFEMEEMVRRGWQSKGDSVFSEDFAGSGQPGRYELCISNLSMVTTGRYDSVQALLVAIEEARFLSVIQDVTIQPIDSNGATVQLELRMSFFGLDSPEVKNTDPLQPDLMAVRTN